MTDLAKAIKRHARLKKNDPELYALAVEFETARFAKRPVSEIVDRIVKHKNRTAEREVALVRALQDILLDGPIWRAQRIAKEALALSRPQPNGATK